MRKVHIPEREGPAEALCPRCRGEATWRFLDDAKSVVEVSCSDCGLFEMPRAEFERAESDIAEPNERQ